MPHDDDDLKEHLSRDRKAILEEWLEAKISSVGASSLMRAPIRLTTAARYIRERYSDLANAGALAVVDAIGTPLWSTVEAHLMLLKATPLVRDVDWAFYEKLLDETRQSHDEHLLDNRGELMQLWHRELTILLARRPSVRSVVADMVRLVKEKRSIWSQTLADTAYSDSAVDSASAGLTEIVQHLTTEDLQRIQGQDFDAVTDALNYILNILGPPPETTGSDSQPPSPQLPVGAV
jgi:hypothetical protein